MEYRQVAEQIESVPCPLGCAADDAFVLRGKDRLHGLPGEFTVVKCRTCGLMRTDPRPTPDAMGSFYPEDYGPYLGTVVDADDAPGRRAPTWRRMVKSLVRFNTQALPDLAPGRMLEIGCASGSFMHKMAGRGWEVEGIEFDAKAAEAARALGHDVHVGPVETAPERDACYDLVVGWMVMEHLHDPVGVLRKLHRWVKPGGWLAVSVPNAGAFEFRLFRDAWFALQLPTHLFHYTPQTFGALLKKTGWSRQRVIHQRVLTNFLISLGYRLQDTGWLAGPGSCLVGWPKRGVAGNLVLYPAAFVAALLGQTGRMTVWARRGTS